jgi:hypothetical protein
MVISGQEAVPASRAIFREFVSDLGPGLPLPGAGATWSRFDALATVSGRDLSAGRLAEGHVDALAILAEADRRPVHGAVYAVWAARRPDGGVEARPVSGGWRLEGIQDFCSGASLVDRALLAADGPRGRLLFDVAVDAVVEARCPDSWPSVGMAGSDSGSLAIGGAVAGDGPVGGPDFYTERRGFWWGAVGVAACWWGGARALVDGLVDMLEEDPGPHVSASLGRAVAAVDSGEAALRLEATRIDGDAAGEVGSAWRRRRALSVRQVVHDRCRDVLAWVADAGGARLVCLDPAQARRSADLYAYLSQHHAGRDAAELGRLAVEARA